jgi:RAQPRD family integrative conjugative element protein
MRSRNIVRQLRHGSKIMRTLYYFGLVLIFIFNSPANADADPEREILVQLVHELEVFAMLVDRAERRADPDARIRFRYDWLRQDLERVRRGIKEHIDAPQSEPRQVPPLRGDYRH